MKLTTRFTTCTEQIQYIINNFTTNTDVELQQRSVEYDAIFRKYETLRPGLLERMPTVKAESNNNEGFEGPAVNGEAVPAEKVKIEVSHTPQQKESDSLLDLLGDGLPITNPSPVVQQPTTESSSSGLMDLLGDLDMGSTAAAPALSKQKKIHFL